jgi:hypothetical protein
MGAGIGMALKDLTCGACVSTGCFDFYGRQVWTIDQHCPFGIVHGDEAFQSYILGQCRRNVVAMSGRVSCTVLVPCLQHQFLSPQTRSYFQSQCV